MTTIMLFMMWAVGLILGTVGVLALIGLGLHSFRLLWYRHRIEVTDEDLRRQQFRSLNEDFILEWLRNVAPKHWQVSHRVVRFHDVKDAILFKMRWL